MRQADGEIRGRLVELATRLLDEKKVDVVLGYQMGTLFLRVRPAFLGEASSSHHLVWNPLCGSNLTVYLPRLLKRRPGSNAPYPPKVAVVVKGCDARSAVGIDFQTAL